MHMKQILLLFSIFLFSKTIQAQQRTKIYFLADTVNINPENRILGIHKDDKLHYFSFFCKCISELDKEPTFFYDRKSIKDNVTKEKPKFKYTSWKDLSEMLYQEKLKFDFKYDLYITEILPDKKFKTNKVRFVRVRGEIDQ